MTHPDAIDAALDDTSDHTQGMTLGTGKRSVAGRMVHHKGQTPQASGGRTAAKHRGDTDETRSRGRAVPVRYNPMGAGPDRSGGGDDAQRVGTFIASWPPPIANAHPSSPFVSQVAGSGSRSMALKRDPYQFEPLPPDHPEVVKEIKFDRIRALMEERPGDKHGDLIDEALGWPDDDDYIS